MTASMTALIRGSSDGSDATIFSAWSSSRFLSSLSRKVVSVISGYAYRDRFSVILRSLNRGLFKNDAFSGCLSLRYRCDRRPRSMHADWVDEYATVHTSWMLMTFARDPWDRAENQDSGNTASIPQGPSETRARARPVRWRRTSTPQGSV